ncbi:MAG: DUF4330 domain-containing protein [Planctomycetes bacterium]|nr:DUF4330 domain-containing protein [Planctomycetota bacterium]
MPLLDDKGRIFGAINVIDASALLFLLAFGALFIAWWTRGEIVPSPLSHEWPRRMIEFDVIVEDPLVAAMVKPGDAPVNAADSHGLRIVKAPVETALAELFDRELPDFDNLPAKVYVVTLRAEAVFPEGKEYPLIGPFTGRPATPAAKGAAFVFEGKECSFQGTLYAWRNAE